MRNGGVAILGNAECEGENRAQEAIEQALNSPLLNDNDIRGAKWILININSAEGEHEFTMDEVEIIQNYLLSQAGENSDVIMGLGYDSTLENKIGITLIATGFEHKEAFEKKVEVIREEDKKIVLPLQTEEKKKVSQPLFLFNEKTEEQPFFVKDEKVIEDSSELKTLKEEDVSLSLQNDKRVEVEMMPTISNPANVEPANDSMGVENREEAKVEQNIYMELSDSENIFPTKVVDNKSKEQEANESKGFHSRNEDTSKSGGFLSKPSQIYARELMSEKPKEVTPVIPPIPKMEVKEEDKDEMKLVTKNEIPDSQECKPVKNDVLAEDEQLIMDESQELKRKAMERIAKLRNLSFNVNSADPHNEFESVPAYLRRNMELHNSIADVESFYTNYTVKSDHNNKAEISTVNSFLEGKKPD
jgi:cell division protein FtsZ